MPITAEMRKRLRQVYKMRPVRGMEYLKEKGRNKTEIWDYDDIGVKMRAKSFTVAKTMGADVLQEIFDAVQKAKAEGTPVKEFVSNLKPTLEKKGWWGKKVVDGKTVTLGTPSRLAVILDTNIKTSYAQGRWESMMNIAKYRPWFVYEQIHRATAREDHKQYDKHIYHHTNPIVTRIFPPRGYGCDCSMRAVTEEEMRRLVGQGYILVETGSEQDKIDTANLTKEMKDFDPIGNYKPEIKDYQPQIKQALKAALGRNDQIRQKKLAEALKSRSKSISDDISNARKQLSKKNISGPELKTVITELKVLSEQIQKLKNSGPGNEAKLKKLTISHTAVLLLANKLRK